MVFCTKCGAVFDEKVNHICREIDIPKERETIYKNGSSMIQSESEAKK